MQFQGEVWDPLTHGLGVNVPLQFAVMRPCQPVLDLRTEVPALQNEMQTLISIMQ